MRENGGEANGDSETWGFNLGIAHQCRGSRSSRDVDLSSWPKRQVYPDSRNSMIAKVYSTRNKSNMIHEIHTP